MKRGIFTSFRWGIFAVLTAILLVVANKIVHATESSPWLSSGQPTLSVRKTFVADADYPATVTQKGNTDCTNLTFTKRDGGFSLPKLYKESKVTGCYVRSDIGLVDSNGYINVNGTDYVAEMTNSSGSPASYRAFPNTDVFISNAGSAAVGVYVWFDQLKTALTFNSSSDGKIKAKISPSNQQPLADKSGHLIPLMGDNFGISENGQWLIVDSPGRAVLRVNLETMEVLPFTASFEMGNGTNAALRSAISSNGRYAVLASKNYSYFEIFDLSTCGSVPNTISAPVSCGSRSLYNFAKSNIHEMGSILQIRFLTDSLLGVYAIYDSASSPKTGQFAFAAPGTSLTGMDYLAMGDSFSSGEGSQKYEVGTDELENLCHLSRVSYPYLISSRLDLNLFHSVACSGARTINLSGGSGIDKNKLNDSRDNQYDDKPSNNSLGEWIPGYDKQVKFVTENNPNLITLTAGGNDIGFAQKIKKCVMPGTCFPAYEDKKEVFNEIDNNFNKLVDTYSITRRAAPPNTRIYVIGYPLLALPGGDCGLNVHLNNEEITFASSVIKHLNEVIKAATLKAGVIYTSVEDALDGYRLCENNSGNIAVNGLTAGNDKFGILGNESYHPNEFGQSLMADAILGTLSVSSNNPSPNSNATVMPLADSDPSLAGSTKTNRGLNKLSSFDIQQKTIKAGQPVRISLNGFGHAIRPNSTYQIKVDNQPHGTVTSDEQGNIDTSITIPGSDPGTHDIDVIGTDLTGQDVDLSTVIDVVGDAEDTGDSCPNIVNSDVDEDQDGIDDSCDPVIGPAPVVTPPETPPSSPSPIVDEPSNNEPDSPTTPPSEEITQPDEELTSPLTVEDTPVDTPPIIVDTNTSPESTPGVNTGSIDQSKPTTGSNNSQAGFKQRSFLEIVGLDHSKVKSLKKMIENNLDPVPLVLETGRTLAQDTYRYPIKYTLLYLLLLLLLLALFYALQKNKKPSPKTYYSQVATSSL